jgi:predicted RNA methylase
MTQDEILAQLDEVIDQPKYKKLAPKEKQRIVGELAQDAELGQWPGDETHLADFAKAKTYPEVNKLVTERKKTFEQVGKARAETERWKLKDAADEEARQRSSTAFTDRAKTLGQDIVRRFFPGDTPSPQPGPAPGMPPGPAPLPAPNVVNTSPNVTNKPPIVINPAPPVNNPPATPLQSGRFQVDEGEIIDTKTRQVIPFDQFERLSTPQEKAEVLPVYSAHHKYDFGAAKEAGVSQDPLTGHWDSRFKHDDNDRRFLPSELGIYDTKNNTIVPQADFDRQATPDQKAEFQQNAPLKASEVQGYLKGAKAPEPAGDTSGMPPGPQVDPRTGQVIPVLKNEPASVLGIERVPQIVKEQAHAGISGFLGSLGQRLRHFQANPEQLSPLNAMAMKVRELTGHTYKTDLMAPVANLMDSLSKAFKQSKAPITPESVPELVAAGVTRFVTETAPDIATLRLLTGNIALSFGAHGLLKGSEFEDDKGNPVFVGLNMHGAQSALINLATLGILHGLAPTSRLVRAGAGTVMGGGLTAAQGGSPQQIVADAITFGTMSALNPGNPQFMKEWWQQKTQPPPEPGAPKDVTPKVPLPGPPGPAASAPPVQPPPVVAPKPPKPKTAKIPPGVTPGVSAEPPPEAVKTPPIVPPAQTPAPAPIVAPGPTAAVSAPPQNVTETPQPQPAGVPGPTPPPVEATVTPEDVHQAADEKGIPWDNDPKFQQLTEEVTGKQHLDELSPDELTQMIEEIKTLPPEKTTTQAPPLTETISPTGETSDVIPGPKSTTASPDDAIVKEKVANPSPALSEKDDETALGSMALAKIVQDHLSADHREPFDKDQLWAWADHAYGGTKAEGTYTAKDAYDAVEIGVNQWVRSHPGLDPSRGDGAPLAAKIIDDIRKHAMAKLPVMGRYRTPEQDEFQQFSTPPDLAYALSWLGNLKRGETVLEPSAGVGGLASFAKNAGATVILNELSPRRHNLLTRMQLGTVHNENAEQLHNILSKKIAAPDVVIMNPPFTSTAGRKEGERSTANVVKHLEQALKLLKPGGRLIALVGKLKEGMKGSEAKRSGPLERWIQETAKTNTFQAQIGLSGKLYKKYGTEYDNQILIFDKIPPAAGHVAVRKDYADVKDALPDLAPIRNSRAAAAPSTHAAGATLPHASESGAPPGRAPNLPTDVVGPGSGAPRGGPAVSLGPPGVGGLPHHPSGGSPPGAAVSAGDSGQPAGGAPAHAKPVPVSKKPEASKPAPVDDAGQRDVGGSESPGLPASVPESSGPGSLTITSAAPGKLLTTEALTDNLYDNYRPKKLQVKDAQPHPAVLVESAVMSAVDPPDPTYTPNLTHESIAKGDVSLAQLEGVVYAGMAHEKFLASGERMGFFIGDGTGVGKGRELAAIIMDNWRRGRKKAVWISEKQSLAEATERDWKDLGGGAKDLLTQNKWGLSDTITAKEGVLFTTYDSLKSGMELSPSGKLRNKGIPKPGALETKPDPARIDQLAAWLGPDYDGVILFDEAHNMSNSIAEKGVLGNTDPSMKALAGVELQRRFPKARIVYASATGATKVDALAYAERLGLWGKGTPFAEKSDFINEVKSRGMAAMELVAQELKSRGLYISRSISYHDVTFSEIEHQITPEQSTMYDTAANAWQLILKNMEAALELTGAQKSRARAAARGRLWGTQLRFFNFVLTSMQMPSVVAQMKKDLEAGHALVLQLTNTNDAPAQDAINRRKSAVAAGEDLDLDNLDITPKQAMLDFLRKAFPVQEYEETLDEFGNTSMRPVVDSQGEPVLNEEAVRMRDELITEVDATLNISKGPLEWILDTFGHERVAEITGRKSRVLMNPHTGKSVEEKRGEASIKKEAKEFQDGKRDVLIFSEKGGTGESYHADLRAKNQKKRMHYLLQAGWRADKAVQGFGRTHRSNQKQAPHYYMVTTNLKGHKRFISTIARRLEVLGSLTKGSRQAGSSGLINAKDNLENDYALAAVHSLITDSWAGQLPEIPFKDLIENRMGLDNLVDKKMNALNKTKLPEVSKFLNRILNLQIDEQNMVFAEFDRRMQAGVEAAAAKGILDTGAETVRAEHVRKTSETVVYADKAHNAETRMVQLELKHKAYLVPPAEIEKHQHFIGYMQNEKSQHVWGVVKAGAHTLENGALSTMYKLFSVVEGQYHYQDYRDDEDLKKHYKLLPEKEGRAKWETAIAEHPGFRTEHINLLVGTMLKIWDRLPKDLIRVQRVQTDEGERFIGMRIANKQLAPLMERLGAELKAPKLTGQQALDAVVKQGARIQMANGWKIERRLVADEKRAELSGSGTGAHYKQLLAEGVKAERIAGDVRYFIPTPAVYEKVVEFRPISALVMPEGLTALLSDERGSMPANPFARKPPESVVGASADDGKFHSHDPEVEARYQAATKGITKTTLSEKLAHYWDTFSRRATRKYEFLPDTAEFAPLQFALDRLEKQKGISNELQMRALHDVVGGLSDPKMDLFTRKVILMDLMQEAQADRLLPYGYTKEGVLRDLEDVDQLLTLNPDVDRAWEERQALWTDMKRRYVQAMDAIGFDVAKKVSKEDYFRHQVLSYAQEMKARGPKGTGDRIRTPTGRSFLKQRVGSTYDINAHYLQAEFEVLAQMDYDVHLAEVIKLVDEHYNIQPRLAQEARQANEKAMRARVAQDGMGSPLYQEWTQIRQGIAMHMKRLKQALQLEEDDTVTMEEINRMAEDPMHMGHASALGVFKWISRRRALIKNTLGDDFKTWEDVIPEGYVPFQPREGNVFYMADSLPHQMVQQLMEKMGAQMGITAEDLKKVLAMGGKREQFVVPEAVEQTLTGMKKPEYAIAQQAWAEIQAMWKAGKLIGPHSVFKYNLRNLTGDAEATFVGNPRAFLFAPRAMKLLFPVFFGKGKLEGPVRDWYDRGGMGTLLQINEMGDVNDLTIFKALQEKSEQRGLTAIPAKAFSKYWKAARLSTDYREAILRLANYLAYTDEIERTGRPSNYGASIKETVDALEDPHDRAFKLSNELIGAYDRISVNGQHLRRYWMPFWSWKEVNFTRYKQLIKNAFKSKNYGAGARGAAFKSASTLLKLAMAYGMLQVWNHLFFSDEEAELNERTRNRVHIILPPGKTADGKITYLDGIGAVGDLLAWVGADSAASHLIAGDLLHDRMTLKELAVVMLKAPFNTIAQSLGPLPVKLPAEMFANSSSYPDVFNPSPIRDRAQHTVQQLTPFGPEYNAAAGKPGKPYFGPESLRSLVVSTQDPGSAAYHNWQGIEDKWRGRMGKASFSAYQRSPKGQALADWAQSVRMKDEAGITKYRKQFTEAGGDLKGMVASVRALAPLNGLTKDERAYVLGNLDTQEKQVLKKAEEYYLNDMMAILPMQQRTELLGSLMEHGGLSSSIIPRKTLPPKLPDLMQRMP